MWNLGQMFGLPKPTLRKSPKPDIEMGYPRSPRKETYDTIHQRTMVKYFRKEIQFMRDQKLSDEAIKRRLRRETTRPSMSESERLQVYNAVKEALSLH